MDENGYYDGWQDFSIKLPANGAVDDFKLQFNGDGYLAQKYQLRDYLDDLISYLISEWLDSYAGSFRVQVSNLYGSTWTHPCLDPGIFIAKTLNNGPTNPKYFINKLEIIYPKS